ncbi:uncharacterized protein LOC112460768 [Temnothorax curvispinosus]|uniref:Uncharacterized protein LOC112460768 n=1 Tax=Temnothorax curvispinosus TaxID=300111 RepID=A0A6J1QG77_9HYME|nr:uncharacterized protein LOC112460768 [Temnothorax curvispinosus]
MVQSWTIFAILISITVLVIITEVVTSLLPNDVFAKNDVKKKHQTDLEIRFIKLPTLEDNVFFWLEVATGIILVLCVILTCYLWCTQISSGRRVRHFIIINWNHFVRRLSHFRRHRGEYHPTRQEQEMHEIVAL